MTRLPFALLAALPAVLAAQQRAAPQPSSCRIHVDTTGGDTKFLMQGGYQTVFSGGGVWAHCVNQPSTRMYSDSFTYFQSNNVAQFIGRVKFKDSSGTLDADKVTYWSQIERLYAEGHVISRNLSSGTEMRGPVMDFYRAAPAIRDTQELTATGRPTIRLQPGGDPARADTANPFIIIADRMHLRHTDRMWGSGHVYIRRTDMKATSDSAALELGDSIGFLIGSPVVIGVDTAKMHGVLPTQGVRLDTARLARGRIRVDTVRTGDSVIVIPDSAVAYRLSGQRMRFDLTGRQSIKRVLSSGDADALGPQWHLTSDTLDMALDSGQIQRAQAWGTERRAIAVSGLNTITADSLDIQMPAQVMREVWAYGRSRATSKADSTWTEDDWLSGDSLHATFARVAHPDSACVSRQSTVDSLQPAVDCRLSTVDSSRARPKSEIERVVAYGTARAYYHTDNQRDPHGERGVNYSRGDRINIAMNEGKVRTVDIVGKVDGVYLEPRPPRTDSTADSTGTDSTRARRDSVGSREPGAVRPAQPAQPTRPSGSRETGALPFAPADGTGPGSRRRAPEGLHDR